MFISWKPLQCKLFLYIMGFFCLQTEIFFIYIMYINDHISFVTFYI